MNIEISDEQIEKLLNKQINERLKMWFHDHDLNSLVRSTVDDIVTMELNSYDYKAMFNKEASNVMNEKILEGVCTRISNDIARAYADKYGDY